MKFLCDRCKTRYSIGDDRVRGKILKIRCKNCANVITVREGMTDADAAEPADARRTRTTTASPTIVGPPLDPAGLAAGAAPNALGAAFATALTTKPPAALEEEWYVSIDGDQSGPFSLSDAQRWVASKAYDADLHCWSEGFDDWLPVDKVSHFRGLRKKPAPAPVAPVAPPPPIPRAIPSLGASAAARLAAQPSPHARPVDEETPKPLFAATMASLERSIPGASNPNLGLPSLNGNGAARATPAGGMPIQAKSNGAAAKSPPAIPAPAVSAKGTASAPTANLGLGSASEKHAFDVGDQATQIEAPAFHDEQATAAEPHRKKLDADAAKVEAKPVEPARPPVVDDDDSDEDGDLAIGEVSRVVNLADLMASRPPRAESIPGAARARASGPLPALHRTGSVPRMGNTAAVPRIDDPAIAAGLGADPMLADAPSELSVAPAVQENHRRGLLILIGVAGLLLAGVVVAVVALVGEGDSDITTLGRGDTIDTTRPDDPLRKAGTPESAGSAQNPFFPQPKNPNTNRPKNPNVGTNVPTNPIDTPLPGGDRLGSDEIEAMARTQSAMTQRCYMRAQRGADAILIGDVKKISVTMDIAPDGTVKTVGLSAHAENTLGKCLTSAIRSWRFRSSPGGTYKISLVFSAS